MKRLLASAATITIAALGTVGLAPGTASAAKPNAVTATLSCSKGVSMSLTVVALDADGGTLGQTQVTCDPTTKRDSETISIPLGTVATSTSFNSSPPQSLPYSQKFPAGFTLTVR